MADPFGNEPGPPEDIDMEELDDDDDEELLQQALLASLAEVRSARLWALQKRAISPSPLAKADNPPSHPQVQPGDPQPQAQHLGDWPGPPPPAQEAGGQSAASLRLCCMHCLQLTPFNPDAHLSSTLSTGPAAPSAQAPVATAPAGAGVSGNALLQALQGAMAAAASPAATHPAAAPQQAAGVSGAALLQALAGAMAAGGGFGAAPPAAAPAPQPQQHVPLGVQQMVTPRMRQDRHAVTSKPSTPAPTWTKAADSWTLPRGAQPPDSALLPSVDAAAQGGAVQQACSKVAGQTVTLGAGGAAGMHLTLTPAEPAGSLRLSASAVDAAVARLPAGTNLVLSLQAAWLRGAEVLAAPEGAAPGVAAVVALWQARLAKRAAGVLSSDDDDDLFFAGGKHRSAFMQALVGSLVACVMLAGKGRGRQRSPTAQHSADACLSCGATLRHTCLLSLAAASHSSVFSLQPACLTLQRCPRLPACLTACLSPGVCHGGPWLPGFHGRCCLHPR